VRSFSASSSSESAATRVSAAMAASAATWAAILGGSARMSGFAASLIQSTAHSS